MKFSNRVRVNRRQETARRQRVLLIVIIAIVMAVTALTVVGRAWDIETQVQSGYGQTAAAYQAEREEVANGISH